MASLLAKDDNAKENMKKIINLKLTEKDKECPVCQKTIIWKIAQNS